MKRTFSYTVFLVMFLPLVVRGQIRYTANSDSLNNTGDSLVSNFLHIPDQFDKWPSWNIFGFVLKSVDSAGITKWQSGMIEPLDKDEQGYLIKTDIPLSITKKYPSTWCAVVYTDSSHPQDTMIYEYGGVRAGDIKLKLQSAPKGAETFLVPNRTWMLKIEKPGGAIDYETVERKYRVNGGPTEIGAFVDETVYVVVYKLNGKYKRVVHYTKPRTVEPEQTVFVNF